MICREPRCGHMLCTAVSAARDRHRMRTESNNITPLKTYTETQTDHVRCIYLYIYLHTYILSFLRAAIHTPVGARTSDCLYVCAQTHSRPRIGGVAAHNGRTASQTGRARLPAVRDAG